MSALVVAGAVGCTSNTAGEGRPTELTVFAAASLQPVFPELGEAFQRNHPDVRIRFNFAGSADLVAQAQQGAGADVIATADPTTMANLGDLVAQPPTVFATNTMQIVVPPGNPGRVRNLRSLTDPRLRLVVCAPQVPCGGATQQIADEASLTLQPVSEESSVTAVMGKVRTGEADAGVAYVTDVRAAGTDVEGIAIPPGRNVSTTYPITVTTGAAPATTAAALDFVEFVHGAAGQAALRGAGFGPP